MTYPGGKAGAGVYQRIINQIPPHSVYVEPFLGDGAVMRRIRPADRTIGIEIDSAVAAEFAGEVPGDRDAENGGGPVGAEIHCCDGIEWLKHAFGLYRLPGTAAVSSVGRSTLPAKAAENGDGRRPLFSAASADAAESGDRIQPVWFVYCDPPYLLSTRRSGRIYAHELSDDGHLDLLNVIRRLPCMVMISGYASPMYSAGLEGWRSISFEAMTRGGTTATEWLWMNYDEPAELHDYRYLGDDKRQRERITRKVRNWTDGLKRLPPLERQAIESAITRRQM